MAVNETGRFHYVFGPVPSRRLGRSLGVDVVPYKRCTLDCIYCQVGKTPEVTLTRGEFVPLDEVLREIDRKLSEGAAPDFITISGSGEPTLYSRLGDLIAAIKTRTQTPVAVITNGTLLWDPAVRDALRDASLVMPSLDAWDETSFASVNRPHPALRFDQIVEGLVTFRNEFSKPIWLEILLLADTPDDRLPVLVELVRRIRPDRIQLNTVARPPAEPFARPMPEQRLRAAAALFGPNAEIIADFQQRHPQPKTTATPEDILALLKRRPCSLEDITAGLSIPQETALEHLATLSASNAIATKTTPPHTYYIALPK